jgi:hypothetical protein
VSSLILDGHCQRQPVDRQRPERDSNYREEPVTRLSPRLAEKQAASTVAMTTHA